VEEQLRKAGAYTWEEGQLRSDPSSSAVNTFHANPTMFRTVMEFCKLQVTQLGVVADLIQFKKEGRRPSVAEQLVKCAEFNTSATVETPSSSIVMSC